MMRKNERMPGEQFTAMLCEKCGELYEPDRPHICKYKNSYPINNLTIEKKKTAALIPEDKLNEIIEKVKRLNETIDKFLNDINNEGETDEQT